MPNFFPASMIASYTRTHESQGMCNSQPSSPTKVILRARTSWPATLITLWVEKGKASLLRSADVRHWSNSRLKRNHIIKIYMYTTFFLCLFLTFLSNFIIVMINLIQLLAVILIRINYLSILSSNVLVLQAYKILLPGSHDRMSDMSLFHSSTP